MIALVNITGTTSDVIRLQNAINSSDTLIINGVYRLNQTIRISKPILIKGGARLIFNKNIKVGVSIESSDVTLSGLTLKSKSKQSKVLQAKGTGKRPLCNLRIEGCTFRGGMNAIDLDYIDDSFITNNHIRSIGYAGIALHSCHNVDVTFNHIIDINLDHANRNSYGIAATFHYGHPKSTNIRINNNIVENNPYWEALDTHGGENIMFINNTVRNCWRGIAAVGDNHRDVQLCQNITIKDNDIVCSDESLSNGIVFTGVSDQYLSQVFIIYGNTVRNSVIGIYSNYTVGAQVFHNDIEATDEGWRDTGSTEFLFNGNHIKLNNKAKTYYDKCGVYLNPTNGVMYKKVGEISNNIVVTGEAPGIFSTRNYNRLGSKLLLIENTIYTDGVKYKGGSMTGLTENTDYYTFIKEKGKEKR